MSDLPSLLHGHRPRTTDPANLGSQRYGEKPLAVVIGGGYSDADVAAMRKTCDGISHIPWLRHDLGSEPTTGISRPKPGAEYGGEIAERVKHRLRELSEEGKLNGDGFFYF